MDEHEEADTYREQNDSTSLEYQHFYTNNVETAVADTTVIVKIGTQQRSFAPSSLQQLSYFEARFASRWTIAMATNTQTVNNQNKNNNSNKSNNCNENKIENDKTSMIVISENDCLGFGVNELEMILNIKQCGKINLQYPCTNEFLEPLLTCNDYLTTKGNEPITSEILYNFITNHKPAVTHQQREKLLENTHSTLLTSVLTKMNHNCAEKTSGMTSKWEKNILKNHRYLNDEILIEHFKQEFNLHWNKKPYAYFATEYNEYDFFEIELITQASIVSSNALNYWAQIKYRQLHKQEKWWKIILDHFKNVSNIIDNVDKQMEKKQSEWFNIVRNNSQTSHLSDDAIKHELENAGKYFGVHFEAKKGGDVAMHTIVLDAMLLIATQSQSMESNWNNIDRNKKEKNEEERKDDIDEGKEKSKETERAKETEKEKEKEKGKDEENNENKQKQVEFEMMFDLLLKLSVKNKTKYKQPLNWFKNIISVLNSDQVDRLFECWVLNGMIKPKGESNDGELLFELFKLICINSSKNSKGYKNLIKNKNFVQGWLSIMLRNYKNVKDNKEGESDEDNEDEDDKLKAHHKWWRKYIGKMMSAQEITIIFTYLLNIRENWEFCYPIHLLNDNLITFFIKSSDMSHVLKVSLHGFSKYIIHDCNTKWAKNTLIGEKLLSCYQFSILIEEIVGNRRVISTINPDILYLLLDHSDMDYLIKDSKHKSICKLLLTEIDYPEYPCITAKKCWQWIKKSLKSKFLNSEHCAILFVQSEPSIDELEVSYEGPGNYIYQLDVQRCRFRRLLLDSCDKQDLKSIMDQFSRFLEQSIHIWPPPQNSRVYSSEEITTFDIAQQNIQQCRKMIDILSKSQITKIVWNLTQNEIIMENMIDSEEIFFYLKHCDYSYGCDLNCKDKFDHWIDVLCNTINYHLETSMTDCVGVVAESSGYDDKGLEKWIFDVLIPKLLSSTQISLLCLKILGQNSSNEINYLSLDYMYKENKKYWRWEGKEATFGSHFITAMLQRGDINVLFENIQDSAQRDDDINVVKRMIHFLVCIEQGKFQHLFHQALESKLSLSTKQTENIALAIVDSIVQRDASVQLDQHLVEWVNLIVGSKLVSSQHIVSTFRQQGSWPTSL